MAWSSAWQTTKSWCDWKQLLWLSKMDLDGMHSTSVVKMAVMCSNSALSSHTALLRLMMMLVSFSRMRMSRWLSGWSSASCLNTLLLDYARCERGSVDVCSYQLLIQSQLDVRCTCATAQAGARHANGRAAPGKNHGADRACMERIVVGALCKLIRRL